MFDYGIANYHIKTIKQAKQLLVEVPVENGQVDKVQARPETNLAMAVTDKEESRLSYALCFPEQVTAPVKINEILGQCKILIAGHEVGRVNLLACNSVAQKTPFLTPFKTACLAVIKFILKAFLVIFLCMYLIRLINLRRRR